MQTFATAAPITVVLNVPAGRVALVAAERGDTTVEVAPADAAKGRDVKAAQQTTVEYADGVLRVETAAEHRLLGPSGAVAVTVHLPAGSAVEATAASAALETTGRLGEVGFEGAYRGIKVAEAAGLRLTATDGDVEVGRLSGRSEISTQRGDIRVAEAGPGTLVLTTQDGAISVGASTGVTASLDAGTTSGRVHNALKSDGAAELEIRATTARGDITARSL